MNLLLSLALAAGLVRAEPIVNPGELAARAQTPIITPAAFATLPIAFSTLPTALQLPALPQLKIDAVANQEIPQAKTPESSFQGLDRFHQSIQMSASKDGGGPQDPGAPKFWDGAHEEENANEEELVYVNRAEKKQEALAYAHAERPALDYRNHRFNKEDAEEFLSETREFPGGGQATGHELLGLLITPDAVRTDHDFDPSRVEMTRFGKSDSDLRPILEEKGIPVYAYHAFLGQAFNYGLVYRVSDNETHKTYHGVPHPVREALGYETEEETKAPAKAADLEKASAFNGALAALAHEAESLPPKEELFEFTAQTVEAAIKSGHLKRDQLSEAFEKRSLSIDFETPTLTEALLTLLESSQGTPWFDKSLNLCRHAVAAGALKQGKLDEILKDL